MSRGPANDSSPPQVSDKAGEGSASIFPEYLLMAPPRSRLALTSPGPGRGRRSGNQQTAIAACSGATGSPPPYFCPLSALGTEHGGIQRARGGWIPLPDR